MKLVCQNPECERLFDGNDRAKCPARYCPECAAERQRESRRQGHQREKARYVPAESGYVLIKDPDDDGGMRPGATISMVEHEAMLRLATYTPGTIIRQGEVRKRIDLVQGKMVEVRI